MEKDYRELYERITESDWFKKAYHDKSLGECPIVVEELEESEDERIRKGLIEALKTSKTVGELKFILPEPTREECIAYLENIKPSFRQIHDSVMWDSGLRAGIELGKRKEASKAIEAVDRIDKYIDENLANAHDMKDSNPDKKYYRGWDDALGAMAGILQDVYSEKENKFAPRVLPSSVAWFEDGDEKQKEQKPSGFSGELGERLKALCPQLEYERGVKDGIQSEKNRHWKPSKEQMDALYNVEFKNVEKFGPILNSLYNDLKKL